MARMTKKQSESLDIKIYRLNPDLDIEDFKLKYERLRKIYPTKAALIGTNYHCIYEGTVKINGSITQFLKHLYINSRSDEEIPDIQETDIICTDVVYGDYYFLDSYGWQKID